MHARIAGAFAAGLALTFATAAARAQGPPSGPGGLGGPNPIMAASVQDDLGLTEKQKDQLKKLDAAMRQRRRPPGPGGGEGGFDPQAMRAAMNALQREQEASVAKI